MKMRLLDRMMLFLLPFFGFLLIRLLGKTWRFTTVGRENVDRLKDEGTSIIYALWHGRMLPLIYTNRNRKVQALVSQHRDGELASRTVHKLGYGTVRGSSTRGGVKGSQDLLSKLGAGYDIAIMPDGPRGPARKVQLGVLRLAQLSGCPIVPVTAGASKHMRLKSWDAFMIPKPFSRCIIMYGPPLRIPSERVPSDASADLLEEKRIELEERLNTMTHEADSYFH